MPYLLRALMLGLIIWLLATHHSVAYAGGDPVHLRPPWRPNPPQHPADWTERYFVDDHEAPQPSADEAARGFLLYRRSNLSLVFDNSLPHVDDAAERLDCRAAPGESESMSLALYALRSLPDVSVEVTDLRADGGQAVIPRAKIEVHVARCLHKRLVGARREFMYMPSWLSGQPRVSVTAGESAWFWVTVHVQETAEPGTYAGSLTVKLNAREKARLPVRLDVLPIRLAALSGYSIGFYDYVDHRTLPSWSVEDRFGQMRAYGMTTVHLGLTGRLKMGRDERGRPQVDFTGSSLVRALQAYKKVGFPAPPGITLNGQIMNVCRQRADLRSVRFAELYLDAVRRLKSECEQQDWPLPILSPRDEASGRPHTHHFVAQQLRLLKQAGFFTELNHFLAYPQVAKEWQMDYLYRNGWAPADYDRARRQIATQIMALQARL